MAFFDATDAFDAALSEVDVLIEEAKQATATRRHYLTYLKAALVLLGAKFEAFAENVVEDFANEVSDLKAKAKHLPRELRVHSTTFLLTSCIPGASFTAKQLAIENLQSAASLWKDDEVLHTVSVSSKFNYGKHGSEELRALFKRVGIADILSECQISVQTNSMIGGSTRAAVTADIDSLTNIRNNIIHSDASPGNITHQQVEGYKDKLWQFGYMVDMRLKAALDAIQSTISRDP